MIVVMGIEINVETCLNSGQCAYLHPELFDVDDDGIPTILVAGTLSPEQRVEAEAAADACPSQSIAVTG